MYINELKALRTKLEEARANLKGYTIMDSTNVMLNTMEINWILEKLKWIKS